MGFSGSADANDRLDQPAGIAEQHNTSRHASDDANALRRGASRVHGARTLPESVSLTAAYNYYGIPLLLVWYTALYYRRALL